MSSGDSGQPPMDGTDVKVYTNMEQHVINCPALATNINVHVQGTRSKNEVVILTVHDLGCNHTMYLDFVAHPKMQGIRDRTVWVHVDVPGQEQDAPDFPAGWQFPTMQKLAEELVPVLDQLNIKEVVCFGEGAGANILARFAMAHIERVLGVCLIHCTGTTAGFMESLKDKVINWKLDHIGMNPTAESYLVLHRFGTREAPSGPSSERRASKYKIETLPEFSKAADQEQLKIAIENYQADLRTRTNPKNLKKFVEAFLKRTSIAENVKKLRCPVLLVTGQKSVFNRTTRALHEAIIRTCEDKAKVEFIEMIGVANIIESKPEKLAECFQYFIQGLGLVSSIPMYNISRPVRNRSMSMEEYDKPLRQRSMSGGSGNLSPLSSTPPRPVPLMETE